MRQYSILLIFFVLSFVFVSWKATAQETSADLRGGSTIIGYDNRACNAGLAGSMRFNSATPCVEFCDSSVWACAGGGGTPCTDDASIECLLEATRSNDDPEFTAANIANGVNILGVTGTYTGDGPFLSATAISGGQFHFCAIKTDGTAWCWGSDSSGRLGDGAPTDAQDTPVAVDTATAPVTGSNWTAINSGGHTCGIRDNGTAWCWGKGTYGERGDGSTTTTQETPVLVGTAGVTGTNWTGVHTGAEHTCGLRDDNTAWCWGRDDDGELGDDAPLTNKSAPVVVSTAGVTGTGWTMVSTGSDHSCGVRDDGSAWCWGKGGSGRIGDGGTTDRPTPVLVDTGTAPVTGSNWTAVQAGASYTCGIRDDGTAWCWGNGTSGRLGYGGTTNQLTPKAVDTASAPVTGTNWTMIRTLVDSFSRVHACGIRDDGTAWCWGDDSQSQLGKGLNAGGDSSPGLVVTTDLPGTAWLAIALNEESSCGLRNNNVVYCWGAGSSGALGTGGYGKPSTGVSQ